MATLTPKSETYRTIIKQFLTQNEKIWLQTNNTELDIGQDLITMGVPKEDIVIGFQPPYMRSFSGYAIA